jgi:hypothetical protein
MRGGYKSSLFYDAKKTRKIERACNAESMLGDGLRCDVVHKIPTFFLLHDRAPLRFPCFFEDLMGRSRVGLAVVACNNCGKSRGKVGGVGGGSVGVVACERLLE